MVFERPVPDIAFADQDLRPEPGAWRNRNPELAPVSRVSGPIKKPAKHREKGVRLRCRAAILDDLDCVYHAVLVHIRERPVHPSGKLAAHLLFDGANAFKPDFVLEISFE